MKRTIVAVLIAVLVVAASVVGAFVLLSMPSGENGSGTEQFTLDSQGGNISAFASTVNLNVPSGALPGQQIITVKTATPSNTSYVPGTAFEFGPNGLSFLKTIQLKISYDPSKLPSGTNESQLSIARMENGNWRTIPASGVNTSQNVVCAGTDSFSTYAVVVNATKVAIGGPYYVYPGGRENLSFAFVSPMAGEVTAYRAVWSIDSTSEGRIWEVSENISSGGHKIIVQYVNNAPVVDSYIDFEADTDAVLGTVVKLSLDILITFDYTTLEGAYYLSGHSETTINIAYPTLSIYPKNANCAPGETIALTPSMEKGPKDAVLEWKWNIDGNEGLLWKVGDDPDVIAGHTEIWLTSAPYVLFRANQDATDGAVVHVALKLWVKYYEMEHAKVSVGEGRANITIVPNAISIEFDYLPMIDLWDEGSASFSVMTVGLPAGNKVYVWNTTGNYGGFGNIWPSSVKSFESTSTWGYYSGNGNGADGDKDVIKVSVYLVQGSDRQLLGNASATIEVYYPQTVYCLLDQDHSTGYIGSGSAWNMYVVDHGHLDWNGFYARKNDTVRIYCQYRGYVPDWEQKDIYLWQGTNKILLVTSAEIVTGMDKTFQITI